MGEFKAPVEQKNKTAAPVQEAKEASSLGEMEYVDSRASTFQLIQLQAAADDQGKGSRITQLQSKSAQFTSSARVAQLQAKSYPQFSATQPPVVQREENKTGLPDGLKSGMESISGMSLSDVKVHRNSDKPAQLQAHAYAQGTDIHLGPGQEKHLPHELGHVVQQKEGRVKPTVQLKGKVNINDDSGLEKEADVLGQKANSVGKKTEKESKVGVVQQKGQEVLQGRFVQPNLVQLAGDGSKNEKSDLQAPDLLSSFYKDKQPKEKTDLQAPDLLNSFYNGKQPEEKTEIHEIPYWAQQIDEKIEIHDTLESAQQGDEKIEIFDVPIEIRDLPKDESIYVEKGKEAGRLLGKAKDFIRNYAATQVSRSKTIKNEKGEYAYSVSTFDKSMIQAVSSGIGAYNEGTEIAEQVKMMDEGAVKKSASVAQSTLADLGSAVTGKFDIKQINIVSKYFGTLEALDIFGVTNILNSLASIAFAWREKSKIEVLKQRVSMAGIAYAFPHELTEMAEYALAKVTRSYYESMAQGILEGLQAVTRIITIASGSTAAIFTEPIKLASKLVQTTIGLYHMVKGVYKFFKGTRGVARKENAEKVFALCSNGDEYALDFLKDYWESGLPMLQSVALAQIRKKKMTPEIERQITDIGNSKIEIFFKMLTTYESTPEVKILKNLVIEMIANEFKSKPPSGSALFQVILKQESVQNGLADAYNQATNS